MRICVITVPYDSGLHRERMGRGPERLLRSGLEPLLARLGHTLTVEDISVPGPHTTEIATMFELCRLVANRVRRCEQEDAFPLLLSGNCNIAVGAVAGCGSDRTGVAWFDAHGEATTPETTASGFLDGMGISILTGQCWRKLASGIPNYSPLPGERVLLIGSRDVEPDEVELLARVGVHRVSGLDELRSGMTILSERVDGVYVHLDLDVLDPSEATANAWTSNDGWSVDVLTKAAEEIRRHSPVKGFGIGSYDPACDRNGNALKAACAVAERLLGEAR